MAVGPVQEWLLRAAKECGTPARMLEEAARSPCENTRTLLTIFARRWRDRQLRLDTWVTRSAEGNR